MSKTYTSTITVPDMDWISSMTEDTESVSDMLHKIMDSPALLLTNQDGQGTPLYSAEQMVEIFKLGARLDETRRQKKLQEYRAQKPHFTLRNMKVGEEVIFPFEAWGSARTAASVIKKQFGSVYTVRKTTPGKLKGDISVVRIC